MCGRAKLKGISIDAEMALITVSGGTLKSNCCRSKLREIVKLLPLWGARRIRKNLLKPKVQLARKAKLLYQKWSRKT